MTHRLGAALLVTSLPLALGLGCGPEPVPCELLEVRFEVPTATPYWAAFQQGDVFEWFECRTEDASLPSDAIDVDEDLGAARIHTCGADGFDATLLSPGVVTVHVVYVDRFWVTRSLELEALESAALPDEERCPAAEAVRHEIDNRVFGPYCSSSENLGEGCSTVAPVCDLDGNWYPSECALLDTLGNRCAIFPGEVCRAT